MTAAVVQQDLAAAVQALRDSRVVVLPTDTLYALSAPAHDDAAVRRVYAIKGREEGKPLPLFVADLAAAERVAVFNAAARRLAGRFWPGALTLVLPRHDSFRSEALAGGDNVALRVPAQPFLLELLKVLDKPITATSANRSGGIDPETVAEVLRQLDGEVDLIVDAGPCPIGVSSTIVDCVSDPPRVLRHGAISEADVLCTLARSDGPAAR
jgi:L-threonylcarbamoyladenylate synthase